MKTRKKSNPLSVIYFLAAFGFTYLLMPFALNFLNIPENKELTVRIKNGQIFIEFITFVVIFLAVAFAMELIFRLFKTKK